MFYKRIRIPLSGMPSLATIHKCITSESIRFCGEALDVVGILIVASEIRQLSICQRARGYCYSYARKKQTDRSTQ